MLQYAAHMFLLPKEYWIVRRTPSKGRGVFAQKDIEPGTVIGDFLGVLQTEQEVDEQERHSKEHYAMHYYGKAFIMPNPKEIGMHTLNHSCAPNCDTYPYRHHVLIFALRRIFKGEELTINYLLDPPDKETVPCQHACYCATPICRGTWHVSPEVAKASEEFVKLHEGDNPKPPRIVYNKPLPPLEKYPRVLKDDNVYDVFGTLTKPAVAQADRALPSLSIIRQRIRETGRRLHFKKLGLSIYGIMNDLLVAEPKRAGR